MRKSVINETRKIHRLLLISLPCLIILMTTPVAFAAGIVEHHQITSKILADAGEIAERELSIYLPEGYDTSELAYPVVYLIHGATGTNRTFLERGYPGWIPVIHVNLTMDKLIEDGKVQPLIVVMPDMNRDGNSRELSYEDYLIREIVPFVDTTYRAIPGRQGRAIAGHSRGGADALYISLTYPMVFSLVGTYASGFYREVPSEDLLKDHDQTSFPLQFWIYVGRNDEFGNLDLNRAFVDILEAVGLPHVFVVDDGSHTSLLAERTAESMEFFSGFFTGNVTPVSPIDELITTRGQIRAHH